MSIRPEQQDFRSLKEPQVAAAEDNLVSFRLGKEKKPAAEQPIQEANAAIFIILQQQRERRAAEEARRRQEEEAEQARKRSSGK